MVSSGRANREPVSGRGARVAIASSRFNDDVVTKLVDGARKALLDAEVSADDILEYPVAGAMELPALCSKLAGSGLFDAIVCCGVVIRGGTPHFDHVSRVAIDGVQEVSRVEELPIGNAILTTDTKEQALDRAGGSDGNKGAEAADAALELLTRFVEIENFIFEEANAAFEEPSSEERS